MGHKKATKREFDIFLYEFQEKEELEKEEKIIRMEIKEEKRIKCLEQQSNEKKRKTRDQEEKEENKELAELLKIPLKCPNEMCTYHSYPKDKWFIRSGNFIQKWSDKIIQKFRCKACGTIFSESTFTDQYGQQKPYIHPKIQELSAKNKSQRQIAKELNVSRKTIAKTLKRKGD